MKYLPKSIFDLKTLFVKRSLKHILSFQYKFDTIGKNIKYNRDENIVYLIQINPIDFVICYNQYPPPNSFLSSQFRSLQNQPRQ
jgi:hypothetical protein